MAEATVATHHPEYDRLLPDVTRNRDAVAGERRIKDKTTQYLPPLSSMLYGCDDDGNTTYTGGLTGEGLSSYRKYLSLAYFYGATGRTVDGLSGLIFTKPPMAEIPEVVDYMGHNANGMGDSLRKLAEAAAIEAFISPQSGILTDYPSAEERVTVAEAERSNLRPKIIHYKFDDIINWYWQVIDNEMRLSLVVLQESVVQRDGFAVGEAIQYRVLELIEGEYHQSVYNEDEELQSGPTKIMVNGDPSPIIPFFFINVGAESKSIINDLVDANLNHYRFFADYAAKEHASAFPVFTETGASDESDNIMIGPGAKWENRNDAAQFGVLQSSSDGGSMRNYLLDMEARMAALGAEMLKPRISGAESAEAKSLDQVAQNSTVGSVALNVSDAISKALAFAAIWAGTDEEASYRLNTDYNPSGLKGQELTAIVSAWQSGAISYDTLYKNLQHGEVASAEHDSEKELENIAREGTGF